MKIGADRWIRKSHVFDTDRKREKALKRHTEERAKHGFSFYDWINANDYIAGVIAEMAKKFDESGSGYPATMTEQEWSAILKRIYAPLECYIRRTGCETLEEEADLYNDVTEALKLFAEHFASFWD